MALEDLFVFRTGMSKNMAKAGSTDLGRYISQKQNDPAWNPTSAEAAKKAEVLLRRRRDRDPCFASAAMPIICLINGNGGSGKDSFIRSINAIENHTGNPVAVSLSPIYPAIEDAVSCLLRELGRYDRLFVAGMEPEINAQSKTPEWRTLAHEIKNAWHKVGDGPNKYVIARVIDTIDEGSPDNLPPFIFVHTREAENIKILKNAFLGLGLRVISILIDGRVETSNQPEDRTVYDFNYDVVIDNSGSPQDLEAKAMKFSASVLEWLYYGNSMLILI